MDFDTSNTARRLAPVTEARPGAELDAMLAAPSLLG